MSCLMLRWGPKPKEGDKMTEHNEDYWMMKANQGLAWLNENDAGAFGTVLEDTLNLLVASASDATEAERLWGAIRSIAGMLPNSFIKRGRGSSLSPEVQASVDSVMNTAEFYRERALEYLIQNEKYFPEYQHPNSDDGMVPDKHTDYYGGLVVPKPWGCGYYGEENLD